MKRKSSYTNYNLRKTIDCLSHYAVLTCIRRVQIYLMCIKHSKKVSMWELIPSIKTLFFS